MGQGPGNSRDIQSAPATSRDQCKKRPRRVLVKQGFAMLGYGLEPLCGPRHSQRRQAQDRQTFQKTEREAGKEKDEVKKQNIRDNSLRILKIRSAFLELLFLFFAVFFKELFTRDDCYLYPLS